MNGTVRSGIMQLDSRNRFINLSHYQNTIYLRIALKPDEELKKFLELSLNRKLKEDEKWEFSFNCRAGADFMNGCRLSAMIEARCDGINIVSDIIPKGSDYKIRFMEKYKIIQTIIQSRLRHIKKT